MYPPPHGTRGEIVDVRVATADRVRGVIGRECPEAGASALARYLMAVSGAFVWVPEPNVVYLIAADTPRDLVAVLRHEALHILLNRLEGAATSKALDRLPPRVLDALDGAGRMRPWRRLARLLRTAS